MQTGTGAQVSALAMEWPDRLGQWASLLCIAHCVITPILLSASSVLAHFLPSDEAVHRILALLIAAIGGVALIAKYRAHRKKVVIYLMLTGLGFIGCGAYWGDRLPGHWAEVGITLTGSLFMIASHRLNHTFCRDCTCSVVSNRAEER